MFFAQTPEWRVLGEELIAALCARFAASGVAEDQFSLVLFAPSSFGAEGFAHRGAATYFPAGMAAAFHLVHALAAIDSGRLASSPDLERALHDMAVWPSDAAANYVADYLTGTTGDTTLDGADYLDWAAKRRRLDLFFWQLGWPEWDGCRVAQKQGRDLRYGREARFVGPKGEGLNALSAHGMARLFWEMFEGDLPLSTTALRRAQLLFFRDATSPNAVLQDFGIARHLGSGIPEGAKIWSKAGQTLWTGEGSTSWVKHEVLRVVHPGMRPLFIAFMAQSRSMAEAEPDLLGMLGRAIWDRVAPHLSDPVQGKSV